VSSPQDFTVQPSGRALRDAIKSGRDFLAGHIVAVGLPLLGVVA